MSERPDSLANQGPKHARSDTGIEWPEFPPPYRPGRHRLDDREARRRELYEAEAAIGLHSRGASHEQNR